MKKSVLDGNLQILLRSQNDRKQQALSCFFDPSDCHDLYPDKVEISHTGTWYLENKGSQLQPDRRFKVWAVYSRIYKEVEDEETQSPVLS